MRFFLFSIDSFWRWSSSLRGESATSANMVLFRQKYKAKKHPKINLKRTNPLREYQIKKNLLVEDIFYMVDYYGIEIHHGRPKAKGRDATKIDVKTMLNVQMCLLVEEVMFLKEINE